MTNTAKQQNLKQPSLLPPKKAALYLQASRVPELQCGSWSRRKPAGPEVRDALGVGVGVGVGAGHRSLFAFKHLVEIFLCPVLYTEGSNVPCPGKPHWDTGYMGYYLC